MQWLPSEWFCSYEPVRIEDLGPILLSSRSNHRYRDWSRGDSGGNHREEGAKGPTETSGLEDKG
jgi:hypothetical protein